MTEFGSMESLDEKPPLYRQQTVAEAQRNKRWMIGGACIILIGVFFFVLGITVLFILYPIVYEKAIYKMTQLKPWTDEWEAWVEPPLPIYYDFVFFHVSNAEEFELGLDVKPKVVEVGPYAYLEAMQKKHIFMTDVDKVSYGQYTEFYYNQTETDRLECKNVLGQSGCTEDDQITILNIIITAVVPMMLPKEGDSPQDIADKEEFLTTFNEALTNPEVCDDCQEGLFLTMSPKQFLFEGYEYKSIKALVYALLTTSRSSSSLARQILEPVAKNHRIDIDSVLTPPLGDREPIKIGIMAGQNATIANQWFTINTGMLNPGYMLNILTFAGKDRLPEEWWPNAASTPSGNSSGVTGVCHDLYGTDGTQYPPYPDTSQRLWVFISDLCRPLWLDYRGQTIVRDTIDAYRYGPSDAVFDMHNPDNYCFCPEFNECAVDPKDGSDEWDFSGCDAKCKDGMIRIQGCAGGAPVVMSAPHFLHGDPTLWEAVDGLYPDYEVHETYIDIEITSGVPLMAHKRIMVSLEMACTDLVTALSKCTDVVFPIFWADESAELDDYNFDLYLHDVVRPENIVLGCCIAMGFIMGAAIIGLGVWVCWKA